MNANELADFIEISKPDDKTHQAIANMLRKQAEEIEYWKRAFERSMSLNDQIRHLEAQVYGGTTK
jgi:hypothetical protein